MTEKKVLQEIANDDWFEPSYKYNPLDSMPIATENPRPEEDSYELWRGADPAKSLHQKMYDLATKNGGSWLGGSENLL
tara:strand:- start:197 stop:430 length:234 start_codon:yes stop_codon:yes gene_type:complete